MKSFAQTKYLGKIRALVKKEPQDDSEKHHCVIGMLLELTLREIQ